MGIQIHIEKKFSLLVKERLRNDIEHSFEISLRGAVQKHM